MAYQVSSSTAIKNFTGLYDWQKAYSLAIITYQLTSTFPTAEQFSLTSQVKRSAASIGANIAEGFLRPTKEDKKHFYTMANGSLTELTIEVNKLIHGLIKSVSAGKGVRA